MDEDSRLTLKQSYDRLAPEYVSHIFDELQHKPLDREILDHFAARMIRESASVCDLGCGPGHVARYLHERGVNGFGIDLSDRMVEQARQLNPGIEFRQGDMRSLADVEDNAWAGIAAFYSIIHVPRPEVPQVLSEMRRVLHPGGLLLLAFHLGDHILHLDELWGQQVSLDFLFFQREEMASCLTAAGFSIEDAIERDPYPDVEYQSRRAYMLAKKQ